MDTSEVRMVNPLNVLALRRIPKLPYIRRYVVIVPSFLLRVGAKMSSWIVKPDHVLVSVQQASDVIDSADAP